MDKVFIEQLTIETIIGIYDWERKIKQKVTFDVDMSFDIKKAAESDSIEFALDYKSVAKRVIEFVEGSEFQLVETLADKVAAIILQEFNVHSLNLKLSKPGAVRGSKAVGVSIYREA